MQAIAPLGKRWPEVSRRQRGVSKNAVTHGINSLSPVAGGESQEDWEAFYQGCLDSFHPSGTVEEELTRELVMLMWRKRRIIRAENSSIDALYDAIDDPDSYPAEAPDISPAKTSSLYGDIPAGVSVLNALRSSESDAELIDADWLNAIELVGDFAGPAQCVYPKEPWTKASFIKFVTKVADSYESSYEDFIDDALAGVDEHFESLERRAQEHRAEVEHRDAQIRRLRKELERAAILPTAAMEARLQRAEAHLGRRFQKVLDHLELLQRTRSGDEMPPPFRLQVTDQ
jgi:hypothetical protein